VLITVISQSIGSRSAGRRAFNWQSITAALQIAQATKESYPPRIERNAQNAKVSIITIQSIIININIDGLIN
jgi:hypothetical protein